MTKWGQGDIHLRIRLEPVAPEIWAEVMDEAVRVLRSGGIVAFPTDTVYGLAADPFNESALTALYHVKGRPEEKPIAVLVAGHEDVERVVSSVPPLARPLMERFWPGPLTLILPAGPGLSSVLTAGRDTLGVRMPDHPVALALLRAWRSPLAVTSANLSGSPDLCTGEEVENVLGDRVPLILDGGRTPGGSPSTVLDMTSSPPRILREGPITREDLAEFMTD
jgi:L-threonylcarbamoyladenylate synthase